jgi:glycosyltransferase involved in cell wall biosynthesis
MHSARAVVVPSLWYEGCPLVVVESLAQSTPVVAFDGTSIGSMMEPRMPRLTAPYGDFDALIGRAVAVVFSSDGAQLSRVSHGTYERRYTHEANLQALTGAYERALRVSRAAAAGGRS